MLIRTDFNLKPFNTFGLNCLAKQLCVVNSADILEELFRGGILQENSLLILGEGSNLLFTKNFEGLVLLNQIFGKEIINEDDDYIYLKVKGGENWSSFVDYTVNESWGGIENLSLIPGTVGAAPVQNIGAYGAELRDVLEEVEAFDLENGELKIFSNTECAFDYRDSIFKSGFKGRYFITSVLLKLHKKPLLNISYASLKKKFEGRNADEINIKEVSDAVKEIRRSKLPDPKQLGNAGSFFKNPIVPFYKVQELAASYPEIPFYKVDEENYKIAAGWLIEKAGWKGKRIGDAGVNEKQALVLVNYGEATGEEIYKLSQKICESVYLKFKINLLPEVNIR